MTNFIYKSGCHAFEAPPRLHAPPGAAQGLESMPAPDGMLSRPFPSRRARSCRGGASKAWHPLWTEFDGQGQQPDFLATVSLRVGASARKLRPAHAVGGTSAPSSR